LGRGVKQERFTSPCFQANFSALTLACDVDDDDDDLQATWSRGASPKPRSGPVRSCRPFRAMSGDAAHHSLLIGS